MAKISLIVAMNYEQVIGVNNQLPWHIPEDLAYFKAHTIGKPIVMGRKTFLSIGKPLANRENIVLSKSGFNYPGVKVYASLNQVLTDFKTVPEIVIIGGGEIFKLALDLVDEMRITWVDYKISKPDSFFPLVDFNQFEVMGADELISKSGVNCKIVHYRRKNGTK